MPEKLQEMFDRQRALAANFIPIENLFSSKEFDINRQQFLASYVQLLQEETIEFLRELPARKFWRPSLNAKPVDVDALKSELADIMHIVIALALISGIDAEEFHQEYIKKNDINLDRVKNNS